MENSIRKSGSQWKAKNHSFELFPLLFLPPSFSLFFSPLYPLYVALLQGLIPPSRRQQNPVLGVVLWGPGAWSLYIAGWEPMRSNWGSPRTRLGQPPGLLASGCAHHAGKEALEMATLWSLSRGLSRDREAETLPWELPPTLGVQGCGSWTHTSTKNIKDFQLLLA